VSAHIDAQTVVTDSYRNTSMIRTLRERWNLGPPLTQRDATAPDIAPVLTRTTPRPQEDWADVAPRPVPQPTSLRCRLLPECVGERHAYRWPESSVPRLPCEPQRTLSREIGRRLTLVSPAGHTRVIPRLGRARVKQRPASDTRGRFGATRAGYGS
jgi:hypothetical protein